VRTLFALELFAGCGTLFRASSAALREGCVSTIAFDICLAWLAWWPLDLANQTLG
jgi:hypothetical protein